MACAAGYAQSYSRESMMTRRFLLFAHCVIALVASAAPLRSAEPLQQFITRRGDQLFEGDQPFRFISFNIPNLQLVEDNYAPSAKTPWIWPNEFELTDALQSVRQMGGTVVRTYVLSVRREADADIGAHVYVRSPGEFNEEAFRALDLALEVANKTGVRLIIPLVDNWKWQGGRGEYAAFRGKQPDDFWTDEQLIADFETTVRFVLTRVNTRTGVAYKDDLAILAWETGNELDSPPAWTRRIAAFIKQLDPKHLVVDGRSLHGVPTESLDDGNIDVITTHHYPNGADTNYAPAIVAAAEACRGKKPYFVGEFGFAPLADMEKTYDAVITSGASGALLWSLRFHHRDGGFYWHDEPMGGKLYKAYHWPGFDSGRGYEERAVLELTRRKAFEIRGLAAPTIEPPAPPRLLPIDDAAAISWQGSAGAHDYVVERADAPESGAADAPRDWQVVGNGVDDSAVQYAPLFHDDSAEPGSSYLYRVVARNEAGSSSPSNVAGPVAVAHRTLVDDCANPTLATLTAGAVSPSTGEDRRRREDVHRLAIGPGGSIVYEVAAPIVSWRAIAFREAGSPELAAEYSADGDLWTPAAVKAQTLSAAGGDYRYLQQQEVASAELPPGTRFLRLSAADANNAAPVELSRIEIRYDAK
jgi:mannan endo-1,4-beta-mannosidase